MLKSARSYEEACRHFRWRVPERYNLAFDVCDRQTMAGSDGHRTALMVDNGTGEVERYTFVLLRLLSNRLANVLRAYGVKKGDRLAVSLPQGIEAALVILAGLKCGAILVPLSDGQEVAETKRCMDDAGVSLAIMSPKAAQMLAKTSSPVVTFDGQLWVAMQNAADSFAPEVTDANDPAFLFYQDHQPGVLHAHRCLLGSLPALEFGLNFFPHYGDIIWTPQSWMGFNGMVLGLLSAWHHGVAVVAGRIDDPAQQLALMGRHGVRALLVDAQHFKALTLAALNHPHPILRIIGVTNGLLDRSFHDFAQKTFDCPVNEIWGALELGAVCANNSQIMEWHQGSAGRAAPGITVDAITGAGYPIQAGEAALLGLSPTSHSGCLGWWQEAEQKSYRVSNGWWVSNIAGKRDLDGYIWPEQELVSFKQPQAQTPVDVPNPTLQPLGPDDRPVQSLPRK